MLAADARLTRIARQWQAQGAGGGLDLLRAWAYLALLLGHDTGSPPPWLVPADASDPTPGPGASPGRDDDPGRDAGPGRDGDHGPDAAPGPGDSNVCPGGGPASGRDVGPAGDAGTAGRGPADGNVGHAWTAGGADGAPVSAGLHRPAAVGDGPDLPPLAGSVNLTVPLTTLLGLAQAPGEAAGYGPLDPDTARVLACAAAGHRATRWHMTVTGPAGRALGHGTARATATGDGQWTVQVTAEPIATGCCEHRNAEPGYRPSPALQRLIRDRATTCCWPGCGRPAARCDLDHTIPHDDGGITCECNHYPR